MELSKIFRISALALILPGVDVLAQTSTPYGDCAETSQFYQDRYEADGNSRDFICFEAALQRELDNIIGAIRSLPACPKSSSFYKYRYQFSRSEQDQACMKAAQNRETLDTEIAWEGCPESSTQYRKLLEELPVSRAEESHDLFACAMVAFDRETEELFQD